MKSRREKIKDYENNICEVERILVEGVESIINCRDSYDVLKAVDIIFYKMTAVRAAICYNLNCKELNISGEEKAFFEKFNDVRKDILNEIAKGEIKGKLYQVKLWLCDLLKEFGRVFNEDPEEGYVFDEAFHDNLEEYEDDLQEEKRKFQKIICGFGEMLDAAYLYLKVSKNGDDISSMLTPMIVGFIRLECMIQYNLYYCQEASQEERLFMDLIGNTWRRLYNRYYENWVDGFKLMRADVKKLRQEFYNLCEAYKKVYSKKRK